MLRGGDMAGNGRIESPNENQRRRDGDYPLVYKPPALPLRRPCLIPAPPPAPRDINPFMMRFLFEKKLQNSDVNSAGRIVIPKKFAEIHLPVLNEKEGIWMHIYDFDLTHMWTFKFRFWLNNRSRMYIFDNTKEFTKQHDLVQGDSIMVFKDYETGSYVIQARKHFENPPIQTVNNRISDGDTSNQVDQRSMPSVIANYRDNMMMDFRDEETPDYAQLVSTPICEPLDLFSPPRG